MQKFGSSGICLDGRKDPGLARASCSTIEHIRAIDGSVPVEEASNLHAGPCRAEMGEIEVAQDALRSTAAPGLARFRQRIDARTRLSKQIPEQPKISVMYVSVTFLGLQRVHTHTDQIRVPLAREMRVADVLAYVKASYPDLPIADDAIVVAVNNKISTMERTLKNRDNVIFFPFLGGG